MSTRPRNGSAPEGAPGGEFAPQPSASPGGEEARARRVAELREAVASGTYRPDAREVAAALLRARTRRALFGADH